MGYATIETPLGLHRARSFLAMTWLNFLFLGSLFCGLGVGLGAFGAHALKNSLSAYALDVFETAVKYQMYHGLALLAVAFVSSRMEVFPVKLAGILFTLGIIVFSGSLYVLALTGVRWLGAITPIGGVCFLVAWISLAYAALAYRG